MKKYDYIFLDLDGPILDGKERHYHCYRDIILKGKGKPLSLEEYWSDKRGKINRNITLQKSMYQGTYEEFLEQWLENIEKREYLALDKLKPNVQQTLVQWRKYANKILLVTMRNNRDNLFFQLDELGLFGLFDEVIACSSYGENIKYNAIKHIESKKSIFIGDTEEDTKTAKLLGIKSIAITNGLRKKEHLVADYYAEEIKDIDLDRL